MQKEIYMPELFIEFSSFSTIKPDLLIQKLSDIVGWVLVIHHTNGLVSHLNNHVLTVLKYEDEIKSY